MQFQTQRTLPSPTRTATGRHPYQNVLNTPPAPPAVDVGALAFGSNAILDDPRYLAANLPPYTSRP